MDEMINEASQVLFRSSPICRGAAPHENEDVESCHTEVNTMDTEDLKAQNGVHTLDIERTNAIPPQTLNPVIVNHLESNIHPKDSIITERVVLFDEERDNSAITPRIYLLPPKMNWQLVEEFERLQIELMDFDEERTEQIIQSKVFNERQNLIDKYNNLPVVSSEITKNIENNNNMIQNVNAELGLNYPLQNLRKFSVFDTDKRIISFVIEERKNAPAKKESLSKKLEATKLNIALTLGMTTSTTTNSLACTKTIESPDGTVDVAKILADNTSLQAKLNLALKTQAQAETFMNLQRLSP
ncbi:hypothetical protein EYC80_002513 [Monilinia laxa]|uniref:Uncharacterized protein n=1 Tax=Monilinia laxa TaxID=61186 RepID=A0A5N6K4A9_MONLA|nr:hypothetical protein EYC80_002513 [Monilinia laxa]